MIEFHSEMFIWNILINLEISLASQKCLFIIIFAVQNMKFPLKIPTRIVYIC